MINSRELQLTLENRDLKRRLKSAEERGKKLADKNIDVAKGVVRFLADVKRFAGPAYARKLDELAKELQDYIDSEVKESDVG